MTALETMRLEKDDFFKRDPESPLTAEQRRDFAGLSYFPEDPSLRLEIAPLEFAKAERIAMQTSTDDAQVYDRHSRFHFQVGGKLAKLTIYKGSNGFFLPFIDALAGTETYPAGRYIEPEPLGGGRFLVDFNLAYNPYCAYNANWSCPLTPHENRLQVPIRAGEKLFANAH